MQCKNAQELFSDYIESKIDRALTVSFENHLQGCPQCLKEVEQLRTMWGALDELPRAEPPAFFHENIMSRVAQEQAKVEEETTRRRTFWDFGAIFRPRATAFAAAALVLLLAGAEVVQTQRASLGPVGYIINAIRPASKAASTVSALEVGQAHWTTGTQANTGTLKITLRPNPSATLVTGSLNVKVLTAGNVEIYHGTANASQESEIEIPLEKQPEGALTLSVQPDGGEATTSAFQITPANP